MALIKDKLSFKYIIACLLYTLSTWLSTDCKICGIFTALLKGFLRNLNEVGDL
jgi:hypothetical protein